MTQTAFVEGKTDEDLFIYMAFTQTPEDKTNANAAFGELHRRYAKDIYARCLSMVRNYPDAKHLAETMTAAALTRAYERADQYQPSEDETSKSPRTKAYLCQIAKNLYLDYRDNPHRPGPLNDVVDLDVHAEQYSAEDFAALLLNDDTASHSREHYKLIAKAFDTLNARTQTVLLETLLQRQRSPGRTYMLRKTAKQLATRIGTSAENVRRIRKNGMDAINDYMKKHKNCKVEYGHE